MKPIETTEPTERRAARIFVLVFLMLAAGIVTTGYFYYRNTERHFRVQVEHQLSAIAELKVSQLTQWRNDRMEDGGFLFKNPSFSALVRRFFAQPADADAQRQLLDWLGKFPTVHGCDLFRLMDTQGVTRLSMPSGLNPATSDTLRVAAEVLRSGQMAFQDFYRHERDHRVYLQVMVPIFDKLDTRRPLGVVELRHDPVIYLYPFLNRWPTPSQTAETLLVRREGNEAVFLNELKFKTNTALNLRVSLANTNLPTVKAALGQEGIVEDVDYRGCPTVACVRAVPDSPWFLVARMDTAEAYAPLRERLWLTVLLVGVLLLSVGASAGAIWRQQRLRFYQERVQAAEALHRSEERYRAMANSANDAIITADGAGNIMGWNHGAERTFGYTEAEVLGQPLTRLMPHGYRDPHAAGLSRVTTGGAPHVIGKTVELEGLRKDGSAFPLEISLAGWQTDAGYFYTGILRDITARKQAKAAQARVSRENELLLSSVGEGIFGLDLEGRTTFANPAAARLLGYSAEEMIGRPQHALIHHTRPDGAPYPREDCPIYAAFKDGQVHHIDTEVFWRKEGTSFPVDYTSTPIRDERGALQGAVVVFRDITERKQAEAEVWAARDYLAKLINTIGDPVLVKDAQHRLVLVNDAECALAGRTREELLGKTDYDFFPKEQVEIFWNMDDRVLETGEDNVNEETLTDARTGTPREVITRKTRYVDPSGGRFVVAVIRDITERKRAEEAMRDAEALYHSLVTQLPQCIFRKDREGRFTFVNQHFCRLLGKTPAEIQGCTDFDFFPRDLAEKYRHDDLRVMQERRACEQVEENALPNGERIFVQVVKTPLVNACGDVVGVQGIFWDITERRRAEAERERLVAGLQSAMARVKTLSGLVPICSGCKKIRDDKNYWHHVESYVSKHTDATFTHGLCPDCARKYFPGLDEDIPDNSTKEWL